MANVPDNLSPGKRPCPFDKAGIELTKIGPKPPRDAWDVDPLRFHRLHPDGHELITRWIARAERAKSKEPFEAFIYAWIGFNGWATCTCDEDGDRAQLWIMELDPRLTQNFDDLMQESEFREAAQGFSSFWPIFRVSDLPEGVRRNRPKEGGRSAVTSYYQSECLTAKRAPDCHMRHTSIDWSHTLEALYQVRCNLFHGQKAGGGGNEDRTILLAAIGVLLPIAVSVLELY